LHELNPFIDAVRQACQLYWLVGAYVTVDEDRVAFSGRHDAVMYNPRKPVKHGFTVHMSACAASTWIHDFLIYPGKLGGEATVGLACDIVLKLTWDLLWHGRTLVGDSWFTSLSLMRKLLAAGTGYVGTLKATMAAGFDAQFGKKKKEGPKKFKPTKGEWRTWRAGAFSATVWGDRSTVNVVSSVDNPSAEAKVKRWSADANARVELPAPPAAATYNRYKGGVDTANQMMHAFEVGADSLRWWVVLAWEVINIAVHNAHILWCHLHPGQKMTNREFRLMLAEELVAKWREQRNAHAAAAAERAGCNHRNINKKRECEECRKNGALTHTRWQCVTCQTSVCPGPCYDAHRRANE
jgi:Transposase IS4